MPTQRVGRALGDAELVEASLDGDRDAFAELVDRYQALVSSVAFALSGGAVHSDEIVQETFAAAWRQLGNLRQPEGFRHWIYGIAHRLTRRFQRNQYFHAVRSAPAAGDSLPSTDPSPLEQMIKREEEQLLRRALSAIPESYRVPLVLFYRERQSMLDITQVLDVSENCIKMRLRRGRQLLSERMAGFIGAAVSDRARLRPAVVAAVLAAIATVPPGRAGAAVAARAIRGGAAMIAVAAISASVLYLGPGFRPRHHPSASGPDGVLPGPPRWAADLSGPRLLSGLGEPSAAGWDPRSHGRPILSFDFEDGILPDVFSQGSVVSCPGGGSNAGNRYCALATVRPWWGQYNVVTLGAPDGKLPLFHYSRTAGLSFDYWLGRNPLANAIVVEVWDPSVPEKYQYRIRTHRATYEAWTHVEARFADFKPTDSKSPPMSDGDEIHCVELWGGQIGGTPLYIDNVKILDHP